MWLASHNRESVWSQTISGSWWLLNAGSWRSYVFENGELLEVSLHAYHCMLTIACLPLHAYHYMLTIACLPLHAYHYMLTIACLPLHAYHCMHTIFSCGLLPTASLLFCINETRLCESTNLKLESHLYLSWAEGADDWQSSITWHNLSLNLSLMLNGFSKGSQS